ncbi:MAG: hypothetical protein Q9171_007116 [Xanthocarpia ochracea]
MNFWPESGYDVAVKIFRAIGVPVSDKNIPPSASQSSITRPVSHSSVQKLPPYSVCSEDTPLKPESFHKNNDPHPYGQSDLGVSSYIDRMSNGSRSFYRQILPKPFDTFGSATCGLTTAGSTGLLPSPDIEKRATASSGHLFPSSSTPDEGPERPATAPLTLTQLMPPRRELPFAREPPGLKAPSDIVTIDETSQKAAKKPASRAKPKPKPKPRKQPSQPPSSSAKPRPASSKRSSAIQQTTLVATDEPSPVVDTTPIATSDIPVLPTPSPTKSTISNHVLTDISANKPPTRSKNTPPPFSHTNTEDISPEEYMTRLDHWVRKYQDLPTTNPKRPTALPPSTDKDQMAAYSAQTEEERLEALDNMICECLEDENFATLVADVEKSWKRIGLGF